MRILHLAPRFWPAVGGAEELLGQFSRRLVADGHQVTVATTDAGSAERLWNPRGRYLTSAQETIHGIRILRFPTRHLPLAPLSYSAVRRLLWLMSRIHTLPLGMLNRMAHYTPWVPDLARWLGQNKGEYDLVMAMNIAFESIPAMGLAYARANAIPFTCFPLTHLGAGALPGHDTLGSFYTMRHQLAVIKQSDLLLAMTPTEGAFYQAHGLAAVKIAIVGSAINPVELNGGDGNRFRAAHGIKGPIVFALGTACYDKGTVHTIRAMHALWQGGLQANLVLAGAMMQDARQELERLPASERRRVYAPGIISDQDKRDLLAAGDILAVPSRTESFGTVYLEAWYYAKPVIGACTWGVQDVIRDGQDGCLVPFGDTVRLARAIKQLADDRDTAHRMGEAGRARLPEYTWDTRYPLIRAAYQQALAAGGRDAPGD